MTNLSTSESESIAARRRAELIEVIVRTVVNEQFSLTVD